MTPSYSHSHALMTFAVEPPKRILKPLDTLFDLFKIEVWISLGAMVFIASTVTILLKLFPAKARRFIVGGWINRTPILNLLAVYLGNSFRMWNDRRDRRAMSTFAKTLFTIWSLGLLIIRESYHGSLYGFLRRESLDTSLDSIKKVVASDCNVQIVAFAVYQIEGYGISPQR